MFGRGPGRTRIESRSAPRRVAGFMPPPYVVNPGCYRQLQQGLRRRRIRTRVMHLAELLVRSYSFAHRRRRGEGGGPDQWAGTCPPLG